MKTKFKSTRTFHIVAAATLLAFAGVVAVIQAATPGVYSFVLKVGTGSNTNAGPAEFWLPQGIATDPGAPKRIYVADTFNHRIQIFDDSGNFLSMFGSQGSGPGEFESPIGVAVDENGWVLVADTDNHRIQLFDHTHAFVREFGVTGGRNYDSSPGTPVNRDADGNYMGPVPTLTGLQYPTRVALRPGTRLNDPLDAAGRIAILDQVNQRVVVLNAQLSGMFAFGTYGTDGNAPGNFENPYGVSMDLTRIYVADPENHRIQIFDQLGNALAAFGSEGPANSPGDLQKPYDVQADASGQLFVLDSERNRILVMIADPDAVRSPRCSEEEASASAGRCAILATDGTWYDARVVGGPGQGDGQLALPYALAVDPSGRLVVADTYHHRFQVFKGATITVTSATVLTAGPVTSGTTINIDVTVANSGGTAVTVTPSLVPRLTVPAPGGGQVPAVAGGSMISPAPATIASGFTAVFHFAYTTDKPGTLSFTASATSPLPGGSLLVAPAILSEPTVVTPAAEPKLSVGIDLSSSVAAVDSTVTVLVTIDNAGSVPLTGILPAVQVTPAGNPPFVVKVSDTTQPDQGPLATGASRTFSFVYRASMVGAVTFTATAVAGYLGATSPISGATAAGVSFRVADDVVPPQTVIAATPQPTASGWYRSAVQITLTATDSVAVRAIHYKLGGSAGQTVRVDGAVATLTLAAQGGSDLTYWAEDTAGLLEARRTAHFEIDSIPPAISPGGVTPLRNAAGWFNVFPRVRFIASDGESGVQSVTGGSNGFVVTTNGAAQVIPGTAKDFAGNESHSSVTVNVDTVAPTIGVCGPTVSPNGLGGWFTAPGPVTVTCTATDQAELSGMASITVDCPRPTGTPSQVGVGVATASCTLSAEGRHVVLVNAKDVAGNLTPTQVTINIDRTPPTVVCRTVSGGQLWPPNHKMVDWNVLVQVTDAISGSAGFTLVDYSSSEAANGRGDGNTRFDMAGWQLGTPDTSGQVRSERSGKGTGRVYSLSYIGADLAGNTRSCVNVLMEVPHDQGKKK